MSKNIRKKEKYVYTLSFISNKLYIMYNKHILGIINKKYDLEHHCSGE